MEHFIEVVGGTDYNMAKDMKFGQIVLNTLESSPKATKKAVGFMFGMTPQGS